MGADTSAGRKNCKLMFLHLYELSACDLQQVAEGHQQDAASLHDDPSKSPGRSAWALPHILPCICNAGECCTLVPSNHAGVLADRVMLQLAKLIKFPESHSAGISIIASVLSQNLPESFFPAPGIADANVDGYKTEVLPSLQVRQLICCALVTMTNLA